MDRRRAPRVAAAFPVRVFGIDAFDQAFTQVASATNISPEGARLEGIRCRLRAGGTIQVQYAARMAQFRIIWVAASASRSEVGIKSLPSENDIWDLNLSQCSEFAGQG